MSKRPTIAPTLERLENDNLSDSVERHPAYGQISLTRSSGGGVLYGSDFEHHNSMVIRISRSELHRGLNQDRPFARQVLLEISMTEAQWATFISTPNSGDGVQCTIDLDEDGWQPHISAPPNRQEQFKAELQGTLQEADEAARKLLDMIDHGGKKAEMRTLIYKVINNLSPNIAFVAQQFGEHMEGVVQKAQIEIAAYIENRIRRAGLQALGADQAPFSLPKPKDEEGKQ